MADDEDRPRFWLPPIRLPPFFPEAFELGFPLPGRRQGTRLGTGWVLVLAAVVDLLDAALVLTADGAALFAGTVVAFLFAVVFAGGYGLLAIWEVVAVLTGVPAATVVPTVLVLTVFRAWYGDAKR